MTSLTLVVHRHAFWRCEREFIRADSAILLAFQLVIAALAILLDSTEAVDGPAGRHLDGELFQVAVAVLRCQFKIVTLLFDILLLPVI